MEPIDAGAPAARWPGVYPAVVTDVRDPAGEGRVRVRLPMLGADDGDGYVAWARLAALMAGAGRGAWFIPEVGDEVLVAFEAGESRRPYVLGALWNGRDAPPVEMDAAGRNDLKVLRSRSGVRVTLDDAEGAARAAFETPGGQAVELRDAGGGAIEIRDASGTVITIDGGRVRVSASGAVEVAAARVAIAAGSVQVDTPMARFSGAVQVDTLIANSVISASYTPGAGNIW